MKGRPSPDKRMRTDGNMAGEERGVGDGDVVANYTIMADMGAGHQVAMVSDLRKAALLGRSMDRHRLSDGDAVSDPYATGSGRMKGQVLRQAADNGMGIHLTALAENRTRPDDGMRGDYTVRPDLHSIFDDGVRANSDGGIQPGGGMNYGCRVGFHVNFETRPFGDP